MATQPSTRPVNRNNLFGANPAAYAGTAVKAHEGWDYSNPIGDPVRAAKYGVVVVSNDAYGAYGRCIIIKHTNGDGTIYAHLNQRLVGVGAAVAEGQLIGYSGWSGNVRPAGPAGAHLHFGYQPVCLGNLNNGYWGCVDPAVLFNGGATNMDDKREAVRNLIYRITGEIHGDADINRNHINDSYEGIIRKFFVTDPGELERAYDRAYQLAYGHDCPKADAAAHRAAGKTYWEILIAVVTDALKNNPGDVSGPKLQKAKELAQQIVAIQ